MLNKLISKDLVIGLTKSRFNKEKVSAACAREKYVKSSFKSKMVSTTQQLELLLMDLCEPMSVQSREGRRQMFVIVDEYSRFTWALFPASKDGTFNMFLIFVKKLKRKLNVQVASIISDHGTKFENASFLEYCEHHEIDHNFSKPRTPQQNGIVEGKNRTLEDIAGTILIGSNLPKSFWVEADNTACYIINRCMIRPLLEKTPSELRKARNINITHLRAFGSKCFVYNNGKQSLGKCDAKRMKESFVGIHHIERLTMCTMRGPHALKKVFI